MVFNKLTGQGFTWNHVIPTQLDTTVMVIIPSVSNHFLIGFDDFHVNAFNFSFHPNWTGLFPSPRIFYFLSRSEFWDWDFSNRFVGRGSLIGRRVLAVF